MAISPNTVNIGNGGTITNTMWENISATSYVPPVVEHHIKGEMLGVSKTVDFTHRMNSPVDDDAYKDIIKRELLQMLVNELWKTKHV